MSKKKKNSDLPVIICILIFSISILILIGYYLFNDNNELEIETSNNESNYYTTNDINNNNNSNTNTNNKDNNSTKTDNNNSKRTYKIGDLIFLKNNTTWGVINNSSETDEFVTILSDDNINESYSISYKNAQNYVSTTYKNKIEKAFKTTGADIKEVRLLTMNDISRLSGISVNELVPGKSIINKKTPSFIYDTETITSDISNGLPLMICGAVSESTENNYGKICLGNNSEYFAIRIVMTINKKYIK